MIAMAAKANNVIPIDTVHINVYDLADLEENLKLAKILGFEGMLVLNPKEIPLVHQYFSPTKEDVQNAKEILIMVEEAKKEGKGVAIMNGKFIGPPMIISAKKTLNKQEQIEAYHKK
jgi:citrate lyase subunit beta/citryl-CoA lyase